MLILSPALVVTKILEFSGEYVCVQRWNEFFGESSSLYLLPAITVALFIPLVLIAILSIIIFFKLKSLKIPGEQLTCDKQQRRQRERNVLKMAIAIVLGFVVCLLPLAIYWLLIVFRLSNIISYVLWPPKLALYCLFHGSSKLCRKSVYLFYFQKKLS